MPGQLKSDAKCPICGDGLMAICDTSRIEGISHIIDREYHHEKEGKRRRLRFCKRRFVGRVETAMGDLERKSLEVGFHSN